MRSDTIPDDELLALLLGGAKPASAVAHELLRSIGGVAMLSRASPQELARISGVGRARAARITAAFELARRGIESRQRREIVGSPEDAFRLLEPRVAGLAQEVFFAIGIDIRNRVVEIVEVARGTVCSVEVHPREVFRPLLKMAATAVVVAHNHPSGDPTPSPEDLALTRRLRETGELVGIPLIDHVVIGQASFRSISEYLGTEL